MTTTKSSRPLTRRPSLPEIAAAADDMVTYGIPAEAFLAYCDQVYNCRYAGIEMALTLKQWWDWWQENDHWRWRGRGANNIMMLRHDQTRGFSLDNIYPGTIIDRRRQSEASRTETEAVRAARAAFGKRAASRLSDREHHPKRRPVEGPPGRFPSVALAAEAIGVNSSTLRHWCAHGKNGWRYVLQLRKRPLTPQGKR